jgi:hypothetical protein
MTFINLSLELDKRTAVIEEKIRNSFKAAKADNDEIKKRIDEISVSLKNSTLSKDLADLNKKVDSNDSSFKKFKKDMARDSLKREVLKEVMPLFNEKINVGLKLVKLENKELKEELNSFKNKWSSANEAKLNTGLAEMRANFAKLDKKAISEMRALKTSTKRSISEQNSLMDQYSANLENYSVELEGHYSRSKKEILSSSERKFNDLKASNDEELARLRGQIAYIKGRVNKEIGVEEVPVKKVVVKESKKESKPGFFSKFVGILSDEGEKKEVKEVQVKSVKVQSKKDKSLFSNLVSLLADESPEIKVEFTPAKEVSKKSKVVKKPVKKLEKQEEKGFFNSIIKSMSD